MFKMTIRTKILTILLALVGIVSLSLLFSQYYFSEKIAIESTNNTFKIISMNISEHMKKEAGETRNILKATSKHKELLSPITFDPLHPSLHGLIQVLQFKSDLHAIYFAQANGSYYEVINMHHRSYMFKVLGAPKQTRWTVITIINNKQQNAFLDEDYMLIGKKSSSTSYDPRVRPWYTKSLKTDEVISTAPYLFTLIKKMGITYAKELDKKGVVLALDYTMERLNSILALQKHDERSEILIVDRNGDKYASSAFAEVKGLDANSTLKMMAFTKKYMQGDIAKNLDKIIKYREGNKNYFLIFHALISKDAYLGIKLDADALMKVHRDNITYSFIIAFLLLLIAIPVILLSVNSIVRPIRDLILENNKIKERRLSEVNVIDTNIKEFQELSDSLVSMSQGIQKYERSQEELLDSIIKLIAEAIDEKSHYTGKHCERVPEIAQLLLNEANSSNLEAFKDFSLSSKEELREFEIGSWLHDCGKVTTPEYVVDKSVKLETIYNRIHEIRMRFEVLWRDVQIAYLSKEIDAETVHMRHDELLDDFEFIAAVNLGGEFMGEGEKMRVKEIAQREWKRHFDDRLGLGQIEGLRYRDKKSESLPVTEKLLDDKVEHIVRREHFDEEAYESEGFKVEVPEYLYNYGEIYNLCVEKGTLTEEERYKINEHVIMSIKMLEKIPFPSDLSKIPEYAGTHHETLDGKGYPKKLTKAELSIPARIMAIADIFEALTASDRPYKKSKTLSESIKIMHLMVQDQHIDRDLFKLFLSSGIYKIYAQKHLKPAQMDEIDVAYYLSNEA